MAVYNELQVGRFNRLLQKLSGIKGPPPVRQLGTEILPVWPMFWGNELRYLESWFMYANTVNIAANVGFPSGVRIRNPVGSNIVAVFMKLVLNNPTGGAAINYQIVGPTPATPANDLPTVVTSNTRFDARGQQNSQLVITQSNTTAGLNTLGNIWYQLFTPAAVNNTDVILTDDEEFPLLPGDAITMCTNSFNSAIACTFMWRERFLEDSERF